MATPNNRKFVVNGEALVLVKGVGALGDPGNNNTPKLWQLGLAAEGIVIAPRYVHRELHPDDFGPDVPAEILWFLADVTIRMTLVHYDEDVLDACMAAAMGGRVDAKGFPLPGTMVQAGTPLGGGQPLLKPGNNYASLNIASPVLDFPWRFPASYLTGPPLEIPLGTTKSMPVLSWRAIPYQLSMGLEVGTSQGSTSVIQEFTSEGVVLWDHTLDTE